MLFKLASRVQTMFTFDTVKQSDYGEGRVGKAEEKEN